MSVTDTVLSLGSDALLSQFIFSLVSIPGGGDTNAVSLRMDQTFDPPEESVGQYEINFRGVKIPKTNMTEGTTKEFSVDVRIDQNWQVFKDLHAWKALVYDPNKGTAMSELATRTTAMVQALDGTGAVKYTFTFYNTKIKSIKAGTFDNGSDDPSRATLTFIYGNCIPS